MDFDSSFLLANRCDAGADPAGPISGGLPLPDEAEFCCDWLGRSYRLDRTAGLASAPVYGATGVAAAQFGGSVIGLSTFLVLVLIATRLAPTSVAEAQALDGRIAYAE